jgi:hypothetical protein
VILVLQLLLALAYSALVHAASALDQPALASAALVVLVVLLLVAPLLHRRAWAWLALPVLLLGVHALHRAGLVAVPILLVPVAFIALVGWWFGRSLRPGRVPLICKVVAAMEDTTLEAMEPALRAYARSLTAAWAWLLGLLSLANLLLALVAVPDGLLARLGVAAPVTVTQTQWSWWANLLNYGLMGLFFLVEYQFRKRRFTPTDGSFLLFARRMMALGPAFWRDFLR